jgi:hypothetical protein
MYEKNEMLKINNAVLYTTESNIIMKKQENNNDHNYKNNSAYINQQTTKNSNKSRIVVDSVVENKKFKNSRSISEVYDCIAVNNNNNLTQKEAKKSTLPHWIKPYIFINIKGLEKKNIQYGNSIENIIEAKYIITLIKYLKIKLNLKNISKELYIITFYSAQIKCIENLIKNDRTLVNDKIKVLTVDSVQGSEVDIVILSMVRSNNDNNVGFVNDYQRLNVALTRSKHMLIVVGCSETFLINNKYNNYINNNDINNNSNKSNNNNNIFNTYSNNNNISTGVIRNDNYNNTNSNIYDINNNIINYNNYNVHSSFQNNTVNRNNNEKNVNNNIYSNVNYNSIQNNNSYNDFCTSNYVIMNNTNIGNNNNNNNLSAESAKNMKNIDLKNALELFILDAKNRKVFYETRDLDLSL